MVLCRRDCSGPRATHHAAQRANPALLLRLPAARAHLSKLDARVRSGQRWRTLGRSGGSPQRRRFLQVRDFGGARDWQHHRAPLQHPRQCDLARRRAVRSCDGVERRPGPGEASRREREVWDEADAFLLAIIEDSFVRPGRRDCPGSARLRPGNGAARLRSARRRPRSARHGARRASSISERTASNCASRGVSRIDTVQLPEADLIDPETAAAVEGLLAEIFRTGRFGNPLIWAGRVKPALVRHQHTLVGMKHLADQLFGDVRPVGLPVSMKFTASTGSCRRVRMASARSTGSPQISGEPVIRMAPKPRRLISTSPPIRKCPASLALVNCHWRSPG